LLYYGWPLPNPYYAKSGGSSNWVQGIVYASLYFKSYAVLLLGVLAFVPLAIATARRRPTAAAQASPPGRLGALWFLWVSAILTLVYVMRVGGDFMFGRFFIPTTPFLLLLIEWLVVQLPYRFLRVAGLVLVAAAILNGARIKHHWLSGKRNVNGVVDESLFYPASRMRDIREQARILRDCLAQTHAVIMVQGGQAALAYYAKFPVAIERYGLTDTHIAHEPIRVRGRPGHEKVGSARYIYERGVNLRINYSELRNVPMYTLFGLQGVRGEIIVYDRKLMDHMKTCGGARFLDFPLYIQQTWLPNVPNEMDFRLRRDWEHFQLFYFMHNPDPEGLREKIRAALAARGITDLPEHVTPPQPSFQDLGTPSVR